MASVGEAPGMEQTPPAHRSAGASGSLAQASESMMWGTARSTLSITLLSYSTHCV